MWCWGLGPGFVHAVQALCQLCYIPIPTPLFSTNKLSGAAEMAQRLGAYTVLPEDLGSLIASMSSGSQQITTDSRVAHFP
ncbi:hypothetical protein I79_006284 [Cricetulus griseus]|uniref:Uncharacterized protein n=1 Tax=Cricetulus griseus TaxID=10029 RepID=G3H7F3_CRIGR|nr:hypothetical protein I79_006284 [Cricetulus griseus]